MRIETKFRLIDSGVALPERNARAEKVARMAKHLIEQETFNDERDAIRSLSFQGFAMADIVMLVDDARQVAVQHVVATEISRP